MPWQPGTILGRQLQHLLHELKMYGGRLFTGVLIARLNRFLVSYNRRKYNTLVEPKLIGLVINVYIVYNKSISLEENKFLGTIRKHYYYYYYEMFSLYSVVINIPILH